MDKNASGLNNSPTIKVQYHKDEILINVKRFSFDFWSFFLMQPCTKK